ncbi:MAG: class I SAM-dependent methyltransferase [Deltaproteobacteria bacterium]|nr:class I SAM-dependent methyltransferase [Deltaproteobacteria bacterium]
MDATESTGPERALPTQRTPAAGDAAFTSSIAALYDEHLGPMIFEPYAVDLAERVAALAPEAVLEIAAGTGVATRAIARRLPPGAALLATDLNPAMLARAEEVGASRPVRWQQADAARLPFGDGTFDVAACQFGAMFFPDKPRAFAEARRVLRPGGAFLFSVWGPLEENEFTEVVVTALARLFPVDPPRFMSRTPHGYFDRAAIAGDLTVAGFTAAPRFERVALRSRAPSAQVTALALCQGTPLRGEIEARPGADLAEVTAACAAALSARFGKGRIEGGMAAQVVTVEA